MVWRTAAGAALCLLLSCTVASAERHDRRPHVTDHEQRPIYLAPVAQHRLPLETVGQLLTVASRTAETRQLPSGRNLTVSRLSVPTANNADVSAGCQILSAIYMQAIGKELWATAMFDATGKLPDGFLTGNVNALGAWDLCMSVHVSLNKSQHPLVPEKYRNFDSRYVSVVLLPPAAAGAHSEEDGLGGVVMPVGPFALGLHGLCVPSTCSAVDASQSLQSLLKGMLMVYPVESHTAAESAQLTSGDKLVISLMAIVGILMVAGTALDMYNRGFLQQLFLESSLKPGATYTLLGSAELKTKNEPAVGTPARRFSVPMLEAFSLYSNTLKLLDTTPAKNTISCLHGIRFLSMTWVVMGHAASFLTLMNGNPLVIQDLMQTYAFAAVNNATVSVDTFFLLSGLLLAYGFCNIYEKTKNVSIGSMYLHRYIRLSIPYAFMIAIAATWVVHIGNGPLWQTGNVAQAAACQKYWWRNLLYIQTFYDYDQNSPQCLGQSWYLADDMQMFLFSPVVLLPLVWRPALGLLWLALVTAAFLALRIVIYSVKSLPPTLLLFSSQLNPDLNNEFMFQYESSWMRVTVWLTGVALGYTLHRLRGRRPQLRWWLVWPSWVAAAVTGVLVVYGMTGYQVPWQQPTAGVSVAYGGLHRFAWGLAVSWVILACATGHGGWVDALLSYPGFVPLSRLTYSGYLVHINVIGFGIWSAKGVIYYDPLRFTYWVLSQIIVTFAVAYAFSMSFEAPFIQLEKVLKTPSKPRVTSENNSTKPSENNGKTSTNTEATDISATATSTAVSDVAPSGGAAPVDISTAAAIKAPDDVSSAITKNHKT